MNTHVKRAIIDHALTLPREEVCGFIYQTEDNVHAYPCVNVSVEDKAENFEIDPQDYITVRGLGRVCGIYHSHVATEAFSEADIALAREMCLPIYLYVVASQGWHSYVPETYHVEEEGVPFAWGVADCLETVRVHYRQACKVHISDYDRDETFESMAGDIIARHVADEGFSYVDMSTPILTDDVLLFRTRNSPQAQHMGVLVAPNRMLHHPRGQLSHIDPLDGAWLRRLVGVLRYTGKAAK
jgi:proteasome lid subunit RPN8/RPN11